MISKILEFPRAYEGLQWMLGSKEGRRWVVQNLIRPESNWRILDVGCGPATILDFLPADISYTGIDLNPHYIAEAKATFGDRGTFVCSDVAALNRSVNEKYDLVLASGLLHHLNDREVQKLSHDVKPLLKPTGRFLTIDGVFTEKQNPIARMMLRMDRGKFVRDLSGYVNLLEKEFSSVRPVIKTDLLRVPYSHLFIESTNLSN